MKNSQIQTAAVSLTRKTVFAFKKRPAIAQKGLQAGKFVLAVNESGLAEKDEVNRFKVVVQLKNVDSKEQPFTVEKEYNILPNGRGINDFAQDYMDWSGRELTEDELYYDFDTEAEIVGKPVVVEIAHRKKGKEWEAFIKSFHPFHDTEVQENQGAVMEEQAV